MTSQATAAAADGRQAAISEAARRLYDAEIALRIARQTGVGAWIIAAYDRLHDAIVSHTAALALPATRELEPQPGRPESRTSCATRPAAA
jgi:hypothetical protein